MGKGNSGPRLDVERRQEYVPGGPTEAFMVPLIFGKVESAIAESAGLIAVKRVLDVGCGRQPFRSLLRSVGFEYIGMDIDQNTEGTVDIVCGIDTELPAAVKAMPPFGLVMCTEVLEHVADWDMAYRNLAALTASGGRILITCPHFYVLHEEPYDFWRPTLHAIRYFAVRHGLRTVTAEAVGDGWDVIGTALAAAGFEARSRRLVDRLSASILSRMRYAGFRLLASRWIQKRVICNGPLYQSNVVVLERTIQETEPL